MEQSGACPVPVAGWGSRMAKGVLKAAAKSLPKTVRFSIYRSALRVPQEQPGLKLKIAETRSELEGCFGLLHDCYVESGFMKPHHSGLRVTPWHALPTTTTLCAKFKGRVVGTVSIMREGVFGLPMGSSFDLSGVRAKGGNIAEISSLAVCKTWRGTSGAILFPLMKFLYGYCVEMFDTKHLAIAVHPERIELYEALLDFQRLPAGDLASYGFANGAPAVGATLDLTTAGEQLRALYRKAPAKRDLRAYMIDAKSASIEYPERRYNVTNDPVMSPDLLEEFCVRRSGMASQLDARRLALLASIYDTPQYRRALPEVDPALRAAAGIRKHPRFALLCPALAHGPRGPWRMQVVEASESGFVAQAPRGCSPDLGFEGLVEVELGAGFASHLRARCVRKSTRGGFERLGFEIDACDAPWSECVGTLHAGSTRWDALPVGVWMR